MLERTGLTARLRAAAHRRAGLHDQREPVRKERHRGPTPQSVGIRVESLPPPDREFVPGETVRVGTVGFTVRHAPGHSPGSVCLVGDGVVFTGDVLFAGSIGRTDLPGADFDTLIRSIERELLVLPDSTMVYSGHGPETTVGRERGTNPFLAGVHRVA